MNPIKPSEITAKTRELIPDIVIEAFNEMIAEEWNGGCAVIRQEDITDRIIAKLKAANPRATFTSKWLNVEDLYREAGWAVEYDKPGYNESYEPTFTFTKKK